MNDVPTTTDSSPETDTPVTPPILAVRDLRKEYGDIRALDDVSFEIRPGEVVGLLGPNGAGKTTCLSCLLGLVEPTGGDVAVAGVDAQANPHVVHEHTAAMLEGIGLSAFPLTDHAVALAVAVGYLAAGYGVFRLCLDRARRRGVLGDY